MSNQLPLEIWSKIASYIPENELKTLLGVNRAFYALAMSARYRVVRVRYFNNELISKLQCLRDVTFARSVQELEIETAAFGLLEEGRKTRWKRVTMEYLRVLVGRRRRVDPYSLTSKPAHQVFDLLLNATKGMRNVRSAYFRVEPKYSSPEHLAILTRLWSGLSRSTRSLTVQIPVNATHIVFPIFTDISLVQHLSIVVTTRALQWASQWTINAAIDVANFLNTASETISSISLHLNGGEGSLALRFLFKNLLPFERLKNVALQAPFDDTLGPDISRFLNAHDSLLTELHLTPTVSSHAMITPLSALQLPSVRSLKLTLYHIPQDHSHQFWSGTLSFSSLTSLNIFCPPMMPEDIATFCHTFRRSGCSWQIETLNLHVCSVDGQVLDVLSITFPGLRSLAVYSKFLSPRDGGCNWDADHFAYEMQPRRYPLWSLHDITLTPPSPHPHFPMPPDAYVAMQIAAVCAPSIRSFCGNGHMDIPRVSARM